MSVSGDEVRRIAALARLSLDETRVSALAEELNGILRHMDVLRDATGVTDPEQGELPAPTVWGSDTMAPSLPSTLVARFAPSMRDGFLLVPRLATHEGDAGASDPAVPS